MSSFVEYANRYTRAALRREDGVLEIRLHDGNGSSMVWDEPAHRELPELFHDVAGDRENKVIILTGTGDTFCASGNSSGWPPKWTAEAWEVLFTEGRRSLENLLNIEVPMIAAINGPATWHAELAVLCDIVLASEDTVFQDAPHFPHSIPSDGVHTVWPTLLGPNRGRYFLLAKEIIDAAEAKRLGIVGEVVPKDRVLARAWELARPIAQQDYLILKYTRLALTLPLKKALLPDLAYGLSLIGMLIAALTVLDLRRVSVFLDFDGTVTLEDSGVYLLERLGLPGWKTVSDEYRRGVIGSRVCLLDEWDLLPHDEVALRAVAAEVQVDPGFVPLVEALREQGAEVTVVSDGFGFLAEDVCAREGVAVLTNRVDWATGELAFPHQDRCCPCSSCGVCKQAPIKDARHRGRLSVVVGDGTSDRKAALLADAVFAKGELARWCGDNGVAYEPFRTLADVHATLLGAATRK